jgi:hypothetical protein
MSPWFARTMAAAFDGKSVGMANSRVIVQQVSTRDIHPITGSRALVGIVASNPGDGTAVTLNTPSGDFVFAFDLPGFGFDEGYVA